MGGSTNASRYDSWVVQDDQGITHMASIGRFFDADGLLKMLQVSTACCPSVVQKMIATHDRFMYAGSNLPTVHLSTIRIVGYRLRETPSCIRCAATPKVF